MSTPSFKRGVPPDPQKPASDGTWLAKFDGECDYCSTRLKAGVDRVRWNEDGTRVVCARHR
jgi:hypothetical protein